jgi:hypothetical protein
MELLDAFRAYLGGLADRDTRAVCTGLAAQVRESLAQLSAKKGASCESVLPEALAPEAPIAARQQANGRVQAVRVNGDRAFIVFHAPGAKLFQLAMMREGGAWKAAAALGSVLVPASGS